jgi:hypothetical protein
MRVFADATRGVVPVTARAERRATSRRAALALFVAPVALAPRRADAADYTEDARTVLDAQKSLLRAGKGDVEAYQKLADDFFARYKFDHKGHTNSFSQLMNNNVIVGQQADYLDSKGLSWAQGEVPPSDSVKGKVLDAYIANGERCLVKEGYPSFGQLKKDPARLAEWKQIECTQGLVKPE